MPRFHLAAAQYSQLLRNANGPRALPLAEALRRIEHDARASLDEAIVFRGFGSGVVSNLQALRVLATSGPAPQ